MGRATYFLEFIKSCWIGKHRDRWRVGKMEGQSSIISGTGRGCRRMSCRFSGISVISDKTRPACHWAGGRLRVASMELRCRRKPIWVPAANYRHLCDWQGRLGRSRAQPSTLVPQSRDGLTVEMVAASAEEPEE
jgi:hypothetical protein